jgi:GNAT superfamily N-acetyltransferase
VIGDMDVRLAEGAELDAARRRLAEFWANPVVMRGTDYDLFDCECLIVGDFAGLAAFSRAERPICELVAVNAFRRGEGIGGRLLAALPRHLGPGFTQVRLGTTNDNLDALTFYQRRGYRLAALRPGAVDAARARKSSIPLIGDHGLPLRDEIDLVLDL